MRRCWRAMKRRRVCEVSDIHKLAEGSTLIRAIALGTGVCIWTGMPNSWVHVCI